ncbi:hypothetical protein AXF42_Ash009918 [Apostasia shenzhenica]|uniref:Uncharacterized protein n=1 Tax=Apostasia shenzhenica TaxID=1088818 RepID=A0A2I0ACB3_9ASPA|nr:hypothetical protein AXF42_Ash009918 [Apostasia shenzhenica]
MDFSISGRGSPFQEGKQRSREEGQPIELLKRRKTLGLHLPLKPEELLIGREKQNEPTNYVEDDETALRLSEIDTAMDDSSLETVSTVLSLAPMSSFSKSSGEISKEPESKNPLLTRNVDVMEVSECVSMRRWKETKIDGFSSGFLGLPPRTKPWRSEFKQKKDEKVENINLDKYTTYSAPTGLNSGLNPGIIKRVRNSKQVNSIIKSMLQSEEPEEQEVHGAAGQLRKGSNETINGRGRHGYSLEHEGCNAADDDVTRASQQVSSKTMDEFLMTEEDLASLPIKAATVAWQWLEMIQLDIKGRVAALRRSKKRIKHVIQTELANLLSKDFSDNQENDELPTANSSMSTSFRKNILDIHVAQWKALFSRMELILFQEGKDLEKWLRQVKELQSKCEEGLKYVKVNGLTHAGSMADVSDLKNKEPWEKGCAVRAAAASIYSTCNLILTGKNPRF